MYLYFKGRNYLYLIDVYLSLRERSSRSLDGGRVSFFLLREEESMNLPKRENLYLLHRENLSGEGESVHLSEKEIIPV